MPNVAMKNPWGRTQADVFGQLSSQVLEAQRSDLFTVNFSKAYDAIWGVLNRSADEGGAVAALLKQFPTKDQLVYFASAVDFPPSQVAVGNSRRHEVPLPFPGAEESFGLVTVTFVQDASGESNLSASKISAFLRGWRALVRAGRAGLSAGDLSLGLLEASANGNSLIPHYRHSFLVELWRGNSTDGNVESQNAGLMELATQWQVKDAWVQSIQFNSLSSKQSGVQELKATFAASAIVEGVVSGGVQIGEIRNLGTVPFVPP